MKIKKKLYWDLILRYVFFLIAAILATITFLMGLVFVATGTISKYPDAAKDINIPFTDIKYDDSAKDLELPIKIGENAWVKVLKGNKVVYSEGKSDDKMEYTQEELALIANDVDEFLNSTEFSYEYIPFTAKDGESYTLIYKMPRIKREGLSLDFNLPQSLKGSEFEREINSRAKMAIGIFFLSIIIIILLFSRITSKKIITPLDKLNAGLKNVMKGDYTTRLELKGSYEFNEIGKAFNYMTERLQMAEKENKEISESKKRLLLHISHDLRTPATTIQGYAEVLYKDMVKDENDKKKYLKYIYDKSNMVTNLIERLFKYSKIESSVYDLNREVKDFSEFLRNVIISYYGELDSKEFNLDIDIPEEKIMFAFDEIELERALGNIIGNIIKYNPVSTTLFVSLTWSKEKIMLMIGDDGIGISKSTKKNIFNPLVRGDNTRKSDGGTGLGLAISKKIIELHDGTISLDSEEGKGSKFFIEFNVDTFKK